MGKENEQNWQAIFDHLDTYGVIDKDQGESDAAPKNLRRRKAGPPELDLHGLRSTDAWDALERFLDSARKRGVAQVRIIHGRGIHSKENNAVLKRLTIQFLQRYSSRYSLRWFPAAPRHGGSGATVVHLN